MSASTKEVYDSVVIVTAVDEMRTEFLHELADSLADQAVPGGCSVIWSVRFDGDTSLKTAGLWRESLEALSKGASLRKVIVGANGVRRGTATTRTMALYAAPRCDWVLSVDADDMLSPGALTALLTSVSAAREAGALFISGKSVRFGVNDLNEPWSSARPDSFGEGLLLQGNIVERARLGDLAPITPNTILYDARLVEALGGWPAVVSAEDLGLLYTVSVLAHGWRIGADVLLRRRWDGQVTSSDEQWHNTEHDLFVYAALRRAECAQEVFGIRGK